MRHLRTLFALFIKFPLRLVLIGLHLLLGVFICFILFRFVAPATQKKVVCWWLRCVCTIMGLRIRTVGSPSTHEPLYIVSNHISWLDIIVIGGQHAVSFLSKDEIRQWYVIGYLGTAAGTLYIKRGRGADDAVRKIQQHLSDNNSIAIFPEGTTRDGFQLGMFYSRMFAAVMHNNIYIQPIAILYPHPDNKKVYTNNPIAPLNNNRNFFISAIRFLIANQTPIIVRYAPAFLPAAGDMRKTIANKARQAIQQEITIAQNSYGT